MKRLIRANTRSCRIARVNEFDNGRIFHSWDKMTEEDAELSAKQASVEDPNDIYYVAYDDIMNPSSDIYWFRGRSYDNYSEVLKVAQGVED